MTRAGVSPLWLSDSRRLLYLNEGRLSLLDTKDGRTTPVGPAKGLAPLDFRIGAGGAFALSRDDRTLYFVRDESQGDIWQMANP
jgi:hypothetical protein